MIIANPPQGHQFYRHKHKKLVQHIAAVQQSDVPRLDFQIIEKIGSGASGEVFKAHYRGNIAILKLNQAVLLIFLLYRI